MKTPLGEQSTFPERYSPESLCGVPRAEARRGTGVVEPLPFHGIDIWNAYELTWLEPAGKPVAAIARITMTAESPRLVESKSLKLYLNSLAMEHFATADDAAARLAADLSTVVGSPCQVEIVPHEAATAIGIASLPGICLDDVDVACAHWEVDPSLLACASTAVAREELHTHLFRSNCPVTGQPDFGSVLLRYRGPTIDRAALLRYLVSYRGHAGFHESCIERIFLDIKSQCGPEDLTVYGRFNRRGGIDINPFRSDFEDCADNPRLWRQ